MESTLTAFALRDDLEGSLVQREHDEDEGTEVPIFTGGIIRAGDSELDVAKALEEGNGVIVVDDKDPAAIVALDNYVALKRVAVPEGAEPVVGDYASRSANALKAEAKRRDLSAGGSKDELVARLEADDAPDSEDGAGE